MPLPHRLEERPLPQDLLSELQQLSTNFATGSLDSSEHHAVNSPLFDEELGWVGTGTDADVDEAFLRARKAQKGWAELDVKDRVKIFRRFHRLVGKHRELLADFIQLETGKDRTAAYDEVLDVLNNARYYANIAPKLLPTVKRPGAFPLITSTSLQRLPKGVVGQILSLIHI